MKKPKQKLNADVAKGNWKQLKGEVGNSLGKLNEDELERTKGNIQSIIGLVQKKYGMTKEKIKAKIEGIAKAVSKETEETKNQALKKATQLTEKVKKDLEKQVSESR